VRKTIYVNAPPIKAKKKLLMTVLTGVSTNKDHYNVCPNGDCASYFDVIKQTTKPYINNTYELDLAYASSKHLYTELGISYSIYRDKFKYTDSTNIHYNTINKYQYFDLNISSGYWFNKAKRKISFIVMGGASVSKLLSASGSTLSKEYTGRVVNLTNQVHLYDYNYRALVKVKALYQLTSSIFAQVSLSYSYDIRSIIKTSDLYIRQRNVFGINIGGSYFF
jgi:hypothetical protein